MSDDRLEPPAGDDADATRALPPNRGDDADATRALPRDGGADDADATRRMPPTGDATGRTARAGGAAERPESGEAATARQQPVDRTAPLPAAWSGRAGVPPPRPVGYQEASTEWYTEEQAGRRWWMPILLGILALLLIALIGVGVWLALRAADRGPEPSPSLTPGPTTAPATTAAPTSAAPSTEPPTSPPTTTATAQVPMPLLVGLPEAAARAALDRLGVDYRVVTRPSDRTAGTVIETDPPAGAPVAEGDHVTVVVAEAAAPTTGAGTPTPAPSASATP
ncbi:PASTA domain-containing protein [Micromonospora sp. NBC_00898]|uniref:PASTA domain-containing protein n=1 Tax=Micromonospora sp. NBC_00898 TaxID=2975981 RepID=UPI00386F7965|nr:PASTA domain-containing protein [Micromonospora sp. NBC_00898]